MYKLSREGKRKKKLKKTLKKVKKSLKKRLTTGNGLWYYIQAVAARADGTGL